MKKSLFNVLFLFLICFCNLSSVFASDKNIVNIYLFYSDTCPHCASEKELINDLMNEYDNIRLYQYEIGNKKNQELLFSAGELFSTSVGGTPFTVIGEKFYKGFSYEDYKTKFMGAIEYYSKYGYDDKLGKFIGNIELPNYPIDDDRPDIDKYINEYDNYKIDIPLIGIVETKNLTLPVISILIGLVDGFNPCAMWVLLFLISMLIGMDDKRKMIILGISFLLSSALIYLLFMLAWLNVASLLVSISYIRISIGMVALIGGIINLYSYLKHRKDNGCNVVNDKKRNKIFDKIKKFTKEENLVLAIIGVVLLAASVNIVELACSAGLPVMFIEILSINNLTLVEEIIYIALYMLFFLLDDLIIFFIAVRTMQVTGFSTKYGKIAKLVGGVILLLIGVLLIVKPEYLMFNF